MDEVHSCPRRIEAPYRRRGDDGQDRWEMRPGMGGQPSVGVCCSYCGSLEPGRFMQLVREGWWVGPTDKSYKAYLHQPLTDEQVAERKKSWMHDQFALFGGAVREAVEHHPEAAAEIEQAWQGMSAAGGCGSSMAKFYYQHLSAEQQQEFIDLVNTKQMKIGVPGHFYVLPFFTQRGSPDGR